MSANDQTASEPKKQTIEDLKKQYDRLNTKKIQAETNLENAQNALKTLQAEAREKFGTDDVAQLKAKLAEMQEANERARSDYQKSLEAIEAALERVETNLAAGQGASENPPRMQQAIEPEPGEMPLTGDADDSIRG